MTYEAVDKILEQVDAAGYEVVLVGGAVRDILAGKNVSDWDLATNAKPEEILAIFKGAFYNNQFGTVGIPVDGEVVEITTYRSEAGYSDRRHPDKVEWGKTLEEDLSRRDFTVNAMALKKVQSGRFKVEGSKWKVQKILNSQFILIDPFNGQGDLKNKVVKAVGNPSERFGEDALRMLRAARFATTLGFTVEKKTGAAVLKNAKLIAEVSGERIRDELFKILASDNPAFGIFLLKDCGILKKILPELFECFAVEQKSPKRHHIWDVGTHCVMSLKFCPSKDTIVRFATLLHDVGKAAVANVTAEGVRTFYNHEVVGARIARDIAQRLHFSKDQREKLYLLVRWHQFSVGEDQTDKALRRFIKNIGIDNVEDMMDLRIGDRLGGGLQEAESWRLKLFRKRLSDVLKKPFTVADLKVSGHDVMKILGLKPGPEVGKVLNKLFEEVADDPKKNKSEYLLAKIEKLKK